MAASKMKLDKQQKKAARKLVKLIKRFGIVLLSGEPRSGKTLAFLEAVKLLGLKKVLIITQKNAIPDITSQAAAIGVEVTITNYHQAIKQIPGFELIILDEAHRWITGYPKRSAIWKSIKRLTKKIPLIYSSGTLTPEGYAGLFNMLALSDKSPWKKYKNFKAWHRDYGKPYKREINSFTIVKYDRTKEAMVMRKVRPFTVTMTRKKAGHTHEPIDKLVHIDLTKKQKKFALELEEDQIIVEEYILADTPAKYIQKMHQLAGGFIKTDDDDLYTFKKNPKIKWLLQNIDPNKTVILAHHKAEQAALAKLFPKTGSVTKNAEGVDFHHIDTLVIYSMSFSAATYEQVRVRQANKQRKKPITILYLVAGIDAYVYKAVSKKKNFTASWYRRNR